nr:tetratricopeptide repeat (TPR)-like superfamily protein [Tanacetum cinerariifolium]
MKHVRTDAQISREKKHISGEPVKIYGDEVKNKSYVFAVKKGTVNYGMEEDKNQQLFLMNRAFRSGIFRYHCAKENFKSHVGIGSWFSILQQASCSFNLDGMVAWVDIEGVPLKVRMKSTFTRIISKWGGYKINPNEIDKRNGEKNKDVQSINEDEANSVVRNARLGSILKEDVEMSTCTGKFKKAEIPRSRASIL